MGPILFNLYTRDMPGLKRASSKIGFYANETVLLDTSKSNQIIVNSLNDTLSEIHNWCVRWRIKINAAKSEAILFSKKQKQTQNLDPPRFNDTPIPWKSDVKYLGVTLAKASLLVNTLLTLKTKLMVR